MNEWNKCDIIDYLKRVYLYLDKELFNTLLIDNTLLIVHTCCAYFMKRVSYMHKKFPKCIEVQTFLLECMAAMLMSTKNITIR